jgi:hypothetical protein
MSFGPNPDGLFIAAAAGQENAETAFIRRLQALAIAQRSGSPASPKLRPFVPKATIEHTFREALDEQERITQTQSLPGYLCIFLNADAEVEEEQPYDCVVTFHKTDGEATKAGHAISELYQGKMSYVICRVMIRRGTPWQAEPHFE